MRTTRDLALFLLTGGFVLSVGVVVYQIVCLI
jgi:hypothetical protein